MRNEVVLQKMLAYTVKLMDYRAGKDMADAPALKERKENACKKSYKYVINNKEFR